VESTIATQATVKPNHRGDTGKKWLFNSAAPGSFAPMPRVEPGAATREVLQDAMKPEQLAGGPHQGLTGFQNLAHDPARLDQPILKRIPAEFLVSTPIFGINTGPILRMDVVEHVRG
jgi:hypothetical protein